MREQFLSSRNFNEFTNTTQLGPEAVILQELLSSQEEGAGGGGGGGGGEGGGGGGGYGDKVQLSYKALQLVLQSPACMAWMSSDRFISPH